MVADSIMTFMAQKHTGTWGRGREYFKNLQGLFHIGGIVLAQNYFKAFPHDYGIIPMPKYNSDQEEFYCGMTMHNMTIMCIPSNARDEEMSAVILQAMSCKGRDVLMPAYYNTVIKGQATRDSESWKMLDLIFESRFYDISTLYSRRTF